MKIFCIEKVQGSSAWLRQADARGSMFTYSQTDAEILEKKLNADPQREWVDVDYFNFLYCLLRQYKILNVIL